MERIIITITILTILTNDNDDNNNSNNNNIKNNNNYNAKTPISSFSLSLFGWCLKIINIKKKKMIIIRI